MIQRFMVVGEPELDPPAQSRLRAAKSLHVVKLQLVALVPPRGVIAILLAAAAVEARRLQVSVGAGRDPNRGPRGRYRQPMDAIEHDGVLDRLAVLVEIQKARTHSLAPQPWLEVAHEAQRSVAHGRLAASMFSAGRRYCVGSFEEVCSVDACDCNDRGGWA